MSNSTRLSLYKLFLETTIWVELSEEEIYQARFWMNRHKSSTRRRNAIDNLYETFLWFPIYDAGRVWVALGHLTRLFKEVEARIPGRASSNHPNVLFRERLRRHRNQRTGAEILALRLAAFPQESAQ